MRRHSHQAQVWPSITWLLHCFHFLCIYIHTVIRKESTLNEETLFCLKCNVHHRNMIVVLVCLSARGSHLVYSCWFTCNRDQNEIKQSRPSRTYNQAVFSATIKSAFSATWSDQDPCTLVHARAHMLVTVHVHISKVSVHLDPGRRWINSCILSDYLLVCLPVCLFICLFVCIPWSCQLHSTMVEN